MNLRSKPFLVICAIIGSCMSGCIKEDTDSCGTHSINVHCFNLTVCDTDTIYPSEIRQITFGIFDKEGTLVSSAQATGVELQRGYVEKLEVEKSGLYTVIAWSGLDERYYDIRELREGVTDKDDLFFRLRRENLHAYSIEGTHLYYGESGAIYISENESTEPLFEDLDLNMQEITNRITIYVEGLPLAADYEVILETDNGSMNVDGTIAEDELVECGVRYVTTNNILEAHFTVLKLETGHTATIVIKHKESGNELFRGSLLGALLLKNPDVNLACDHDFEIHFTTRDQCDCGDYVISEIWINDWLVHSYEKEM